jgi:hypothetical protein
VYIQRRWVGDLRCALVVNIHSHQGLSTIVANQVGFACLVPLGRLLNSFLESNISNKKLPTRGIFVGRWLH